MNTTISPDSTIKPYSRSTYQALVRTAILSGQIRFARQAALNWLAAYPGDMGFGLLYGRVLMAEGNLKNALQVLDGLCQADAQWLDAATLWLQIYRAALAQAEGSGGKDEPLAARFHLAAATYFALNGRPESSTGDQISLPAWSSDLYQARLALGRNDLGAAESYLRQVLAAEPPTSLAAITHLQLLAARVAETGDNEAQGAVLLKFAQRYAQLWPESLACSLYVADALTTCTLGDSEHHSRQSERAVALLHQVASRDVAGQVARRLWGDHHPYRSLWPERLEQPLKLQIPAEVAAHLGWNRLPGPAAEPVVKTILSEKSVPVEAIAPAILTLPAQKVVLLEKEAPVEALEPSEPLAESPVSQPTMVIDEAEIETWLNAQPEPVPPAPEEPESPAQPLDDSPPHAGQVEQSDAVKAIRQELQRLAERLRQPELARLDGRFPIYVIFSARSRLQAVYGEQATAIETAMLRLLQAVQSQPDWGARLFFADDPASTTPLGIQAARPGDAWSLKRSLTDLDAALAKRGEMVGAVLIVGGPEIIPFHHLPNPVDDPDLDVPSDNPYGSRDQNYFIPEWPVGRMPGGEGGDASLLLEMLRQAAIQHANRPRSSTSRPWYLRWATWLLSRLGGARLPLKGGGSSYGYTAEIWRKASGAVFRPIGDPAALHSSPPCGVNGGALDMKAGQPSVKAPVLLGDLGYFNLHGLSNSPEWFGQRDPLGRQPGPDYPVALRPQDIHVNGRQPKERRWSKKVSTPRVVFSEACYGLLIQSKSIEEAISLKFLQSGSQAVVGSTCMSYGAVAEPLAAADFLGRSFWRSVRAGLPIGEALRLAKLDLADSMTRRQGYLDGEDQKTLISFVLYGDPLAQPLEARYSGKRVQRHYAPNAMPPMVCEHSECPVSAGVEMLELSIPDEVLQSVRQAAARYLPGMQDAEMTILQPRQLCQGGYCSKQVSLKDAHSKQPGERRSTRLTTRRLVTLSKQLPDQHGLHSAIARVTLDEDGKVIKMVISR